MFHYQVQSQAEKIVLINVGGWPARLPGVKGTRSCGAPPGLCVLGTCWRTSFRLRSCGRAAVLQKRADAGKKPRGTDREPLGATGSPAAPAVPRGKRPLGLSVPLLRGRAEEEEAVTEGGAGSRCRGRPVGASLRETGTSPAQPGRTAGLPPYLFQFLPSPEPFPGRRAAGHSGARGAEGAGAGGFLPGWFQTPAGRESG